MMALVKGYAVRGYTVATTIMANTQKSFNKTTIEQSIEQLKQQPTRPVFS